MVFISALIEETKKKLEDVSKLNDHPKKEHINNLLESMYHDMSWEEADRYFLNFLSLLEEGIVAYEYLEHNGLGNFLEKFKEVFE